MHHHLPNFDRLSALIATILLIYSMSRLIELPARELALQLPGIYLSTRVNLSTLVGFLAAMLTAVGTAWLISDHPAVASRIPLQHTLVPGLTAWVIELPLSQLPFSGYWWIAFGFGAILLSLEIIAEYIAVDPDDARQPLAAAGLTAVSFSLYLVLAAGLKFAGSRLFILLPILVLAGSLVSLRTLHLRLHGRWLFLQTIVIAILSAQVIAAIHYLPFSPVSFGLALLAPAYSLTSLVGNLAEGEQFRQAVVEPVIILILVWGVALWNQ
jgi:hypothetical protein